MLGLTLVSVGLLLLFVSDSSVFGLLENFVGLSPTLIVAGALALEPAIVGAPNLLFLTIGNASYSIYLSHLFFLRLPELGWQHFAFFGSSKALDATYVTLALLFAIVGGILIYHFIERPMLLLIRRRRTLISAKSKAPRGLEESARKIGEVK
jgi:peptidoglycan/LPS O-acetylase OafA/YrhL